MKLRLKKFNQDEITLYYQWMRNPLFCGAHAAPDPSTIEELSRSYSETNGWCAKDFTRLLIVDKTDSEINPTPIGFCHFWKFDKYESHLEFGRMIHPSKRGQGLGLPSLILLINYIFTHSDANRIQAITSVNNIGNIKCWKKAGINIEGKLRSFTTINQKPVDCFLGSLLRSEWRITF